MNANELAEKIENYCYWSIIDFHYIKESADMLRNQKNEIELLEDELFVKGAIRKSYKEALEQIAIGEIAGESTNYKDTVYVMRQIASNALAILRKASEK